MLIYVLFWFQPYNVQASPEETADQEVTANEMMNQNLDQVNLDELKMFWDDIMNKYSEFLPAAQKGSLMEFIKGEKEFSFSGWLAGFGKYIFHELLQNGKLLGMLILLDDDVFISFCDKYTWLQYNSYILLIVERL